MKKIFTLFASLVLSLSLLAAAPLQSGKLTIISADNSDIRVVVDGKLFDPNGNSIIIQGIDAGQHSVKVYRQRTNGMYNVMGGRYDMVYNTSLIMKKRSSIKLTIARNGRVDVEETRIRKNESRNGRVFDYDQDGKWGSYDSHYGYENTMRSAEFNRVLESIDKEWLESNKLKSATQVVRSNRFTTAQVKQLVQLFTFENNKLELAKQAYANTVDKENYYQVSQLFSFNANKSDLERYIRNFR